MWSVTHQWINRMLTVSLDGGKTDHTETDLFLPAPFCPVSFSPFSYSIISNNKMMVIFTPGAEDGK